jgi:hypothetical protein
MALTAPVVMAPAARRAAPMIVTTGPYSTAMSEGADADSTAAATPPT